MPILANAKKALRVSKRKAEYNRIIRSKLKTMFDAVAKKMTLESLNEAFSAVDKAVKRNIIHINKAARLKRQLQATVNKSDKKA